MQGRLGARETIQVGEPTIVDATSEDGHWYVVFEDDGDTGTFYACQSEEPGGEVSIVATLHVYDVENVADAEVPSVVEIWWTDDGSAAALVIDDEPHAVFDFRDRRAASRTGNASSDAFHISHQWDDTLLERF